ncbi:hypothetical protein FACS189472_02310 [Alphaproteobacteria bacterium]|nr:hypothetical protein FACS189472_02310 [Alphaproteobacteria bacterium]
MIDAQNMPGLFWAWEPTVNAQYKVNDVGELTPLHLATLYKGQRIVEILLNKKDTDANATYA